MTRDSEARFATCRSCRETAPLDDLLRCTALESGAVDYVHRPLIGHCWDRSARSALVESIRSASDEATR